METDDLKSVLARVLGLQDDDVSRSARYAEARAHLAERLAGTAEPAPLSIEEVAAYASGAMDGEELQAFEKKMLASEEFFQEVMSALEFLDRVDEVHETAPEELVDAFLVKRRGVVSAAGDVQGHPLTVSVLLPFFQGKQSLTREQQGMLFRDPQFRAEFDRLKRQFSARGPSGDVFEMPALAAAASDLDASDRPFFIKRPLKGGLVSGGFVVGSEVSEGGVEILFTLDEVGKSPGKILLQLGEITWIEKLPAPRSDGKIFLLKDKTKEDHQLFLRLLQDDETTGTFIS